MNCQFVNGDFIQSLAQGHWFKRTLIVRNMEEIYKTLEKLAMGSVTALVQIGTKYIDDVLMILPF
jgi:hypothetical protein